MQNLVKITFLETSDAYFLEVSRKTSLVLTPEICALLGTRFLELQNSATLRKFVEINGPKTGTANLDLLMITYQNGR